MITNHLSRRALLAGLATAGLAASDHLGMPFISRGLAAAPIRIGLGTCPAAVSASEARGQRFGAEAALRQVGGKVLGQPVQLIPFEEGEGASTTTEFRKLVKDQGIVGLIGGATDDSAMTLQRLAGEAKLPLIIHTAMSDDITSNNCNRWTYRVPVPLGVQLRALRPYLTEYAKRWFILSSSDQVGKRNVVVARTTMKEAGVTEAGALLINPANVSFPTVIETIKASRAEAVVSAMPSSELGRFLKAWQTAGLRDKVTFAHVGMTDGDLWAAGPQLATGIYTKTYHFKNPKNPPELKELVAAYARQFNGDMPSNTVFQAHMAMVALLSSIGYAGSPEAPRAVAALDHFGSPFGDITLRFRGSDHQMLHRVPILETKTKIRTRQDFWDVETIVPENPADLEKLYDISGTAACLPRNA